MGLSGKRSRRAQNDDVDWDDDDYSDMENGQACIGPSFVIFYVVLVVIWGD